MALGHLRYFVAVAEELRFGNAGRRLGIDKHALSGQIKAVERELEVMLLFRKRRRVQVTPAGQVFLERSRLLLSRAEDAIVAAQRVSEGTSGSLKLGFVGSATYDAIPSILRSFHQIAPQVELTLSEMTVHAQLEALAEKRIDLGFLRLPARTEGLVFRTVSREALLIALPSSHSLAQLPVLRLSSLAGEPFILYPDHPRPSWAEFIVGLCPQAGSPPTIAQPPLDLQPPLPLLP